MNNTNDTINEPLENYDIPQLLEDFLIYMETIRGKSPQTVKEYYYDLRLFLKFLKIKKGLVKVKDLNDYEKIEQIDITDIQADFMQKIVLSDLYAYMSYLNKNRHNNSAARARKVASIKSFFKYLHNKAGILENNIAVELESPKTVKRLPRYLDLKDSKNLLDSIDGKHKERDYAIITIFLNCGLRLQELVDINISKLRNDTLTVIGKGDKERMIYLNDACLRAIDEYKKVRPIPKVGHEDALFLSERRQRISNKTVQFLVKKYIKQAGLDPERYSTHKLRHTAATLMYKHGHVDIRALQSILGHESISTTEIYTHLDNNQLRDAAFKNPLADEKASFESDETKKPGENDKD
ncbi:MAG TPA: recombinase XerC [Clostridiales bacterium]|nr:recombinase XerC [Clostridiales bacterium]